MKNSQALYILLLAHNFLNISASPQLEEFLKSVKNVNSDLTWLKNMPSDDIHRRKRSETIEELLSRFEFGDEDAELHDNDLQAGDAWYQSFRALECRHGGCPKRPLRWKAKKAQPEDYYEYYEESAEAPKTLDLKDQWEETKNDLSHEANYKLSKVEQDAVEKSLPNTAWPVRHDTKRNTDAMQKIKLKTSLRMIKNGDGASLPSASLDDNQPKISVEDILGESKHEESPDPWKESYEVMESRKLLSVDDADDETIESILEEKLCGSKNCLSHVLDLQEFDNTKEKNHMNRELEGLSFDNTETGHDVEDDKKGTVMSLSDELMHSTAFLKLQNFLKGRGAKPNKTTTTLAPKTTTGRPQAKVPLNLVEKDNRNVNIKLHMSVNATVLGEGKLPEQFHRNNTITFKPPAKETKTKKKETKGHLLGLDDMDLDRDRRDVVFPIFTANTKRKTNEEITKSVVEATETFPLDEIITGKLTSQLVKTIFALVKSSPSLKILWPGLMRNQVASPKQVQNFYAIRTHENESEMHRTEVMLRQAMETINAIIEQQVRSRSCVPLRADLKAFYNQIIATKAENDRFQDRQKRETDDTETPSMSDTQIRKKSRIVKKLLKDYEELPTEDQGQVVNIKDNLLIAAEELRDLEQRSRRRKRAILENYFVDNSTSLYNLRDLEPQLTPQYLKLAKTAEMFLHNSLKDPDLTMGFNFI